MSNAPMVSHGYKYYWKISFDVRNGEPRIFQEIALWEKEGGKPFNRVARREVSLDPQQLGPVSCNDRTATFDGGCLVVTSLPLTAFEISGYPLDHNGMSDPNMGENISVRAEIKLLESGDTGNNPKRWPIFSFPQQRSQELVSLSEKVLNDIRHVGWHIAANDLDSDLLPGSDGFTLSDKEWTDDDSIGWHNLRVRQVAATVDSCYFQYWIDGVRLGEIGNVPCSYTFAPGGTEFYIGAIPTDLLAAKNAMGEAKLDHLNVLHGKIRSLVFDPNDSCGGCLTAG